MDLNDILMMPRSIELNKNIIINKFIADILENKEKVVLTKEYEDNYLLNFNSYNTRSIFTG